MTTQPHPRTWRMHANAIGLAAALVCLIASVQQLDGISEHQAAADVAQATQLAQASAMTDRREWQHRVSVCLRSAGPGAEPAEDADGRFFCQPRQP